MFVRPEELATALKLVVAGSCVSIVGPDGSGRSTLLREIASNLTRRGYEVIQLTGIEALSEQPFSALELAGEYPRPGISDGSTGHTVDALAKRAATTRVAFLIDDAQFVDDHSWGVVAATRSRTEVPVVTASPGSQEGRVGQRLHAMVSQAAELRLHPLTFEAVSDLIHEQLEGPVDTGLIGRIFTKSAGIPSLATALVTVARAHGQVSRIEGTWRETRGLWHESMAGAVEHLLVRLDEDALEAIETLALAGVVDVTTAGELIGAHQVEALEAHDRLLVIEPLGRQSVTVTPPVISDYFQHQPHSVRRSRILYRIQHQFDFQEPSARPMEFVPPLLTDEATTPDPSEAALLRLIRDRHAAQLATRHHAWERNPSVETAVHYLQALLDGPHDRASALTVFTQTNTDQGEQSAQAEYRILRARWQALAAGDVEAGLATLRTVPNDLRAFSARFAVNALELEVRRFGIPADIEDRLQHLASQHPTSTDAVLAARTAMMILQGRSESADALLVSGPDDTTTRLGRALTMLRGWAMLGRGSVRDAHEWAVSHLEQSRVDLDIESFREHTYLAAVTAVGLGRFHQAEVLLGGVLAIGRPGVGQEQSYMGTLAVAAMLAARAGRTSSAESLAQQAMATGLDLGPWPGMVAVLPEIAFRLLDGDADGAARHLRETVKRLEARGYRFAAATLAVFAPAIGADGLPLGISTQDISDIEGTLISPLIELSQAIEAHDRHKLYQLGLWLEGQGRLEQASMAFEHGRKIAAAQNDAEEEGRFVGALGRIAVLRDPRDLALSGVHPSLQRQLSPREREVARLAAQGLSNQEIATHLGLSPRTVESHLLKSFRKLRITTRSDLTNFSWT